MKNQEKFIFYTIVTIFFCLCSTFMALVTFPITNLTLVFYSFSVPFIWKTSLILGWQSKKLSMHPQHKKIAMGYMFFSLFYITVSALSIFSCLTLFPHPSIHQILIAIIYTTGVFMALKIIYCSYCINTGKTSSVMNLKYNITQSYNQICSLRQCYIEKYKESFLKNVSKDNKKFVYNGKKYLLRRLLSTGVYVFLFLWIFAIIPIMYIENMRPLYVYSTTITIIISFIVMINAFVNAFKSCELFVDRIIIHSSGKSTTIYWEEINSVTIKDTELIVKTNKNYSIPFYNIHNKSDLEFLQYFIDKGTLLFSKKTSSPDLDNDDFIKKLLKEKGRKLSSQCQVEKIDDNNVYLMDKDDCFSIRKTESGVDVFNGKLPYSIYFMTEPFWKQLSKYLKKNDNKELALFQEEYVKRVTIS